MRKLLLSLLCLLFMTGVVLSADAIFVSFKDSKLTVKEGDAEKTYKVTDATKITITDADGNKKDGKVKALETMKAGKKIDITTEKDVVTAIGIKAAKKKN